MKQPSSLRSMSIVIDQRLVAGGGFNQAIKYSETVYKYCIENNIQVTILSLHAQSSKVLNRMGLPSITCHINLFHKAYMWLVSSLTTLGLPSLLLQHLPLTKLESKIFITGSSIAFFVSPTWFPLSFLRIPYISCIWDVCHRDHPEFPEVYSYGEFTRRESLFARLIPQAVATIVDSLEAKKRVEYFYRADPSRVIVNYFGDTTSSYIPKSTTLTTSKILPLDVAPFIFYPAQLWPHKNHALLLEALSILNEVSDHTLHLILTGKDYGNLGHINCLISRYSLDHYVHYLGFIEHEQIHEIYGKSSAVVMPSYFGPTNLPPIEATTLLKPVVLPDSPGYRELFGDYPYYYAQGDAQSLARSIHLAVWKCDPSRVSGAKDRLLNVYSTQSPIGTIISDFFKKKENWES